ncbi:MAG: hypothetical protein HY276_09805 [Ignavibacteriales bacterium]|nr:hypothetical protein [Ignavibacteriales bacterium]
MRKKSIVLLLFLLCGSLMAQDKQFTPGGKFSGLMFGDYFYNVDQRDTTKKDMNGFQFRRIYFTYDYAIAENFNTRFRLEADQSANTSNGKIGVFVKDAYLQWKNIFQGSDLFFGISPTPAYDISEGAWGYRSLEKTIMDLRGVVPSRDFGLDIKGKFDDGGTANYWLKFGNNSANSPETDKYKRYYANFQFKLTPQFQFTIYGDYDTRANKIDSFDKQGKSNNRSTLAGFINYAEKDKYSLGVEGFYQTIQNNFKNSPAAALQDQKVSGISLFAWYAVSNDIRLVGRFDTYDPNGDVDKDGISLLILAVDYIPAKNVHCMPNLYLQSYQSDGASDVIARITFYYQF